MQNKTVDRFTQEKLYIQLMRIFLEQINSGKWQLGQQIPTEEELCKIYNVSKITVRQAVNNLVSDGYLIKIQGKGTFVVSSLPVIGLSMRTTLTEDMFGKEVKLERKVLSKGIKEPDPEIRTFLKTDAPIYYILSKRLGNGKTAYVEEAFIPQGILPHIDKLDITQGSFYSILQEKASKKVFKVIQTIEVSRSAGDVSQHLEVEDGFPLLVIHRLFLSSDDMPVAYTEIQGRSDRYKFQTEFERIR
ncbi:GntR family transcriptional regulator [Dissulfurispira thermophila]|uniref:GntR family transcriptional regulator n=1 Tax=Dissulfurispira thermophila TaxID=2715679 RepID=UPI00193E6D1B|nr:GntR family transcriptional regulator [Dissulfurispira thermophila]